jgi:hypothetical protein
MVELQEPYVRKLIDALKLKARGAYLQSGMPLVIMRHGRTLGTSRPEAQPKSRTGSHAPGRNRARSDDRFVGCQRRGFDGGIQADPGVAREKKRHAK